MKIILKCLGLALVTSASLATPAAATPLAAPSAVQNAVTPAVETVQWRWRRGAWAPLAGAAIVGGAIAASRYYNYYDNYYGDYAYAPGYRYGNYSGDYAYSPGYRYSYGNSYGDYAYSPGYRSSWGPSYTYESSGGDDVAYCRQRFRSYDPASGTYLGYDGQRHPCP
jgi:hypothetical protein